LLCLFNKKIKGNLSYVDCNGRKRKVEFPFLTTTYFLTMFAGQAGLGGFKEFNALWLGRIFISDLNAVLGMQWG
jgi:hypothetical protein